jgi:hypothetical protein
MIGNGMEIIVSIEVFVDDKLAGINESRTSR